MGDYKIHKDTLKALKSIEEQLDVADAIDVKELDITKTVLITIDTINGFVKSGALSSPRLYSTMGKWVTLHEKLLGYMKVFFIDAHTSDSVEFEAYPEHCISGEWESEIIEELDPYVDQESWIIYKNSTNGFLTHDFMEWLKDYPVVDSFVIIGDCTDICIKQFALTLKAYFNENNVYSRIIVPIEETETFHLESTNHDGNLMNLMSYYEMKNSGIEIVKTID